MVPASPKMLVSCLTHVMGEAGNKQLIDQALLLTLADRAMGNYRALCTLANELLMEGARRNLSHIDEKLFLELTGELSF